MIARRPPARIARGDGTPRYHSAVKGRPPVFPRSGCHVDFSANRVINQDSAAALRKFMQISENGAQRGANGEKARETRVRGRHEKQKENSNFRVFRRVGRVFVRIMMRITAYGRANRYESVENLPARLQNLPVILYNGAAAGRPARRPDDGRITAVIQWKKKKSLRTKSTRARTRC